MYNSVLRIRIRGFLTPGSGMKKIRIQDTGYGIRYLIDSPDHYSKAVVKICCVVLKYFVSDPPGCMIRCFFTPDPGPFLSGIRGLFYPGSGIEKFGTGLNITDPQHWYNYVTGTA
jgi:hypothetical protein